VIELRDDHLKLEPDPVLAAMLRSMRLQVAERREPFEPEGGAYAAGAHRHDTHGVHEHHDHHHHRHGGDDSR
jgi:urease accessory protein